MRQTDEFFGEKDLELLHIAKRLSEAKAVEETLSAAGVDYMVEVDQYLGGVIFQSARAGAFFYVLPEELKRARAALGEKRIRIFTLEAPPD